MKSRSEVVRAICGLMLALAALPSACIGGQPGAAQDPDWQQKRGAIIAQLAKSDVDGRLAAVKSLAGFDNAEVVALLVQCLTDEANRMATTRNPQDLIGREELVGAIQQALSKLAAAESVKAMADACPRLTAIAQSTLLFAFKEIKAPEIDAACLKALDSGDSRVLVPAMEALGAHNCADAVPKIVAKLDERNPLCVRIAAVRSLALMPDSRSCAPLIAAIEKQGGRVGEEAENALRMITGLKDVRGSANWKNWLAKNKDAIEKLDPKTPPGAVQFNSELDKDAEYSYYEIPVHEKRLLFVIDRSGSMTLGGKPNRMDGVKTELKALIQKLSKDTWFNIIDFSTNVLQWQKQGLVQASPAMKASAVEYVDKMAAKGATRTIEAMQQAVETIAVRDGVEVIFLLTDGNPNDQKGPIQAEDAARRIKAMNKCQKVRIHTIGIFTKSDTDPPQATALEPPVEKLKDLLSRVAKENDGVFREVNKEPEQKK